MRHILRPLALCALFAFAVVGGAYVLDAHCRQCDPLVVVSPVRPGILVVSALDRTTNMNVVKPDGDLTRNAALVMIGSSVVFWFFVALTAPLVIALIRRRLSRVQY